MDLDQDGSDLETDNGTILVQLNDDGSLTLLEYGKDVRILKTNVVGFVIAVVAYTQINVRLYEDASNPYKKRPKITAEVGSVLTIGSKDKKIKIKEYEKELPPLTLKFTLEKIESVIELLRGDFVSKVRELKDLIVNG